MNRSDIFLNQVEAFLARHGIAATTFGKAVCNDPMLVSDLRHGRKPNLDLCDQILQWMANHEQAMVFEVEADE